MKSYKDTVKKKKKQYGSRLLNNFLRIPSRISEPQLL